MNHCVPGFQMGGDYAAPPGFSRPKKPSVGEEDIMELLWQNGQVVVQTQNQKPTKKTTFGAGELAIQVEKEIRQSGEEPQHLFMHEYEMASWLQYPLDDSSFDRDLYADFLYGAPTPPAPVSTITQPRAVAEIRPPSAPPRPSIPPPSTKPDNSPRLQNFVHFSRLPSRPRTESMNKPSVTTARESTVVESNETPAMDPGSRISHSAADSRHTVIVESGTATATGRTTAVSGDMAAGTRDVTVSSSPGGSGTSFIASDEARKPQQKPPPAPEKRKRKAREADDNECQSEDIEFEGMKRGRCSSSTKRSRAAEVHNLSERRRRDRINEKMRALQELIPRCNKSDKASMLDEAIEYLKSLQLQVQMMSMGCGMIPMMYPGMQQYMPAMGLGMGMGMSMDMGLNRSMIPYPTMHPDSGMANPAAAAQMGARFPRPAFHMPGPDPSLVQASNHTDPALNPAISHHPNQHRMPNFIDPYQQFLSLHQAQLPLPQNQGATQPCSNKPISSKDIITPDNQQRG